MAPPQWAYQVENYVTPPDEELVCSICRAVFCDPTLCPCDHVFCKVCITKWLQSNRNCPICRKRASLSSIKPAVPIVKNIIMKHMLQCRNKTFGCSAKFSVESSEAHVKECGYEFVQCKNKPCTDKLFRKDITEHETKDCPHRAIRCKKCRCKIPTSSGTVEHDCIAALRELVKERSQMVLAKSTRIKQLKAEIKNLKAKMKENSHSRMPDFSRGHSLNSDTLSSISPDEITINIHEFDSASSTSSNSDMSSDNFYILTSGSLSVDNEESDSLSMDNDNNVENGDAHDVNEYRNAESQTVEPLTALQNDETQAVSGFKNLFPHLFTDNDSELQSGSRRPAKRSPTTQKPAKRRFPPVTLSSNDEDEHTPSSISLKDTWRAKLFDKDERTKVEQGEPGPSSASAQADLPDRLMSKKPAKRRYLPTTLSSNDEDEDETRSLKELWRAVLLHKAEQGEPGPSSSSAQADLRSHLMPKKQSSYMEAGPSSASIQSDHLTSKKQSSNNEAGPSSASVQSDLSDHSISRKRSHPKRKQQAKQTGKYFRDNAVSSRIITSNNPVFERTLALLEQHSLESDPEWLPDHTRLRESDTTESDSSYVVESSDSDLSDAESIDSQFSFDPTYLPALRDFMNWTFDSTSDDDDPDWKPPSDCIPPPFEDLSK